MASGYGGAAGLGGVADPRLGDEADAIGKGRNGSTAEGIHDSVVRDTRRGSINYNDSTVSFEEYHYWAQRSREYERTIDVSNTGLQGTMKVLLGKGQHADHPVQDIGVGSGSDTDAKVSEKHGDGAVGESRYGITESEWDNAQRSVRTATWGES